MILTEFNGKKLLKKAGFLVPKSILLTLNKTNDLSEVENFNFPVFVKAQVFHGNRELSGLVKKVNKFDDLKSIVDEMFLRKDIYNQNINEILIEEAIVFDVQMYLSITYNTEKRTPVINFSNQGGVGMDNRGKFVQTMPISLTKRLQEFPFQPELLSSVNKLIQVFAQNDATLVEINPLVRVSDNFYCLDSKIELETVASYRHEEWKQYKNKTSSGAALTKMELEAHNISKMDHRGVAGESFFEFTDGNIAVMASGGGASVLAMDALLLENLKPANYTEYSGNPTREKVKLLTKLVLSKQNLKALYVVGSNANFTDIYETLSGVVDGLLESSYAVESSNKTQRKFRVLIRRGGPRWQEAFRMIEKRLDKNIFKLKLFGPDFPIVKTASELKKILN